MKKIVLSSITTLAFALASCGGSKTETINNSGIDEQYAKDSIAMAQLGIIHSFSEGELYGFKNEKDSVIIKPTYAYADYEFIPENVIRVQDANKKWGVINKFGKTVIPFVYDDIYVTEKSNNFICLTNNSNTYGVINYKGDTIIPFEYKQISFAKNNSFICENKDYNYGILNTRNEVILPFNYGYISTILVRNRIIFKAKDSEKYGFMDSTYKVAIIPEFKQVKDFSKLGLAAVMNDGNKWGVINSKNEKIVNFEYDDIWYYSSNGFAAVTNDRVHYGFINRVGKLVIPMKYYVQIEFGNSDNTASVKLNKDDKESFKIDTLGNTVK